MIIEFKIEEEDFLDHLLFTASQSKQIKRKITNGQLLLSLSFAGIAIVYFFINKMILVPYFVFWGVIFGLFYPKYFRWRFRKHCKTSIRENHSGEFGQIYLEIRDNVIFSKDKTGEGTINISEIDQIYETGRHFFIKTSTGAFLIIPKYKMSCADEIKVRFESLGFTVNSITRRKWKV